MNVFQNDDLKWMHFTGDEHSPYPISYWGAVLRVENDHVDFLYRWDPDSYCHYHRHVCHTTSVVLEGQLHIIDFEDGKEVGTRVRTAGSYSHMSDHDVHLERGGPEGALVLFSLYSEDGRLVEQLADDGSVIATRTIQAIKNAKG